MTGTFGEKMEKQTLREQPSKENGKTTGLKGSSFGLGFWHLFGLSTLAFLAFLLALPFEKLQLGSDCNLSIHLLLVLA